MTDLPDGWTSSTVGSLCEKVDKIDPVDLGRSEFLYVDIGSITPGQLWDSEPSVIAVGDAPTRARQLLEAGDTLFSTVRPYLLKIVGVSDDLHGEIASTGFCVLRPRESVLVPRLLTYYCVSDHALNQILPLQRGVSYPAVRDKEVAATLMPLPPREEQDEIVRILDTQLARLDTVLEAVQAVRDRADQLRRSLLQNLYWSMPSEWVRFDDLAQIASNLVSPDEYPTHPHIAPNHVEAGTGRLLPFQSVSEDGVTSNKHLFQSGCILYSKIRPYLNKVVRVDFDGLCSADMYPIETEQNRTWLWGLMLSDEFVHRVSSAQNRTVLPKTNVRSLSATLVPLASRERQCQVAEVLETLVPLLERIRATAELVEAKCGRLRRSLLQAAFTGELTKTWREANG